MRRCLGRWILCDKLFTYKMRKKILNILISSQGTTGEMVLNEKPIQNWKLRGFKLHGLTWNQINTPYFKYNIDQRKKLNILDDFENKTPTQFQKFNKNFKIKFPGNRSKIFESLKSAWLTESVPSFWNRKIAHIKKLCRFLISEFNLSNSIDKVGAPFDQI